MHCNKLAGITCDWTLNIENGRRQAVAYIDFAKALSVKLINVQI